MSHGPKASMQMTGTVSNSTVLTSKLFAGLEAAASEEILTAARLKEVSTGQVIVSEGEAATHLFLLKSGRVKYFRTTKAGEEVVLWLLIAGDVLGIATLLEDPPGYVGTAEVVSKGEFFIWDHAAIRRLARKYPQLSENSLRMVLHYLQDYTERHVGLMTRTAPQRLARTLLELGDRVGKVGPEGLEITVTNQQLSGLADTSRFTISRVLNTWERRGAVTKSRGNLLVRDLESLIV